MKEVQSISTRDYDSRIDMFDMVTQARNNCNAKSSSHSLVCEIKDTVCTGIIPNTIELQCIEEMSIP